VPKLLLASASVPLLALAASSALAASPKKDERPAPAFMLMGYGGYHLFVQPEENFRSSGVVGGRLGVDITHHFALEGAFGYVQTTTNVEFGAEGGKLVHLYNPRFNVDFFFTRGRVAPYVQVGIGAKSFSIQNRGAEETIRVEDGDGLPQPKNPDTDFQWDAAAGLRLMPLPVLGIDLNARYLMSLDAGEEYTSESGDITFDDRFDNFEFTVGVFALLGKLPPKDRDGDGIVDKEDDCPDDPEDKDGFQDEDGCPDPDNDQDGILDGEDGCPNEPEDKDRFEDQDGCPDPDNDKDGIADRQDGCPDEPEDKDGFEDQDGCPDPDNDKDGIADKDDRCPLDPETRNGIEDEDGCPDLAPVGPAKFSGSLPRVLFGLDRAVVEGDQGAVVDEVAATLKRFPEVRVRIDGHASSEASDAYNLALSRRRAQAVLNALVQRGISKKRLSIRAAGEAEPVAPDTETDRYLNRCAVFVVTAGEGSVEAPR